MRNCNQGYMQSKTDSHKRCVKIINRSVCSKKGKEFSSHTRKCRKACKINEDRIVRKDKRGTRCRLKCRSNQEREVLNIVVNDVLPLRSGFSD